MFADCPRPPSILRFAPVLMGLLTMCFTLGTGIARAADDSSADVQIVTVEGAGTDVESARKDACRAAVRQVVGAVVSAKTLTVNDELIDDKIIDLSSGFVEKMEPLKDWKADGLVRVKVLATVRTTKIQDTLRANGVSVINVDGQSLGAKLLTTDDQRKGAADFVEAAFEGFPAKWFKATLKGEPRLGKRTPGEPVPVIVTVLIEPDYKAFEAAAENLEKAMNATKRPHGEFQVDAAKKSAWFSLQDASGRLQNELIDGVDRGADNPHVSVVECVECRELFPLVITDLDAASRSNDGGGQKPLIPSGVVPVTFPVKFMGGGRRSTWKWYGMEFDEAKTLFSSRIGKHVTCRTTLLDKQGDKIAIDDWEIETLGIGGMRYCDEGTLVTTGLHPVVIAPAAVTRQDLSYLFSSFTCERTFMLEEDEIRTVSSASVELK